MQFQSYVLAAGLEKKEWNRFVREVGNGKKTSHRATKALVKALAPHYPEFKIDDLELFKAIFPGKKFSVPRLRVLRTYFKTLLEEFLIDGELRTNEPMRDLILTMALKERNLLSQSEKVARGAQERIMNSPLEFDSLENDLLFEKECQGIFVRTQRRSERYDWDKLMTKLETYSLAKRLQFLCAMFNVNQVQSDEGGQEYRIRQVFKEVEAAGADLHPLSIIHYHILKLLTGAEINTHFPALESQFKQHGGRISRIERMNIFGFLTNYLFWLDRKGDPKSLPALFRSFKVMHEQDLIFGAGAFSVVMVRNITGVGARMGEVPWTSAFLKEAQTKLPSPENENAYQYGSAYLAFTEGKYPEARKKLAQVEYADPFYRLANDNLLLRISYETKDTELFYSVNATLNRHLYRKEGISPRIRKALQSLLKAMMVLFELRWGTFDPDAFADARRMIESFEDVYNRDWLRAKIAELEKIHQ
jgi:hypothetical protein